MQTLTFELKGDYIELIQLLKVVDIAQTGGHAKIIVGNNDVERNGSIETRKRAKIRKGDSIVVFNSITILIQ